MDPSAWYLAPLTILMTPFTISPPEGALTNIHLCASPEVAGMTSKYFDKCKPVPSSPASYDVDVARRLWDVSAELTAAR